MQGFSNLDVGLVGIYRFSDPDGKALTHLKVNLVQIQIMNSAIKTHMTASVNSQYNWNYTRDQTATAVEITQQTIWTHRPVIVQSPEAQECKPFHKQHTRTLTQASKNMITTQTRTTNLKTLWPKSAQAHTHTHTYNNANTQHHNRYKQTCRQTCNTTTE